MDSIVDTGIHLVKSMETSEGKNTSRRFPPKDVYLENTLLHA
jgi:hypothetical protein